MANLRCARARAHLKSGSSLILSFLKGMYYALAQEDKL